jgi:hypothetical protein
MRRGALYRSDEPVRLTPAGREAVARLRLAFVVDVRQHSQYVRGTGFLDPARTSHVPLVDRVIDPANPPTLESPADMANLYLGMLARSSEPLARALDTIADHLSEGPVLVHCVYGKDRAGLVTALVQCAIGVTSESIVADYARSDLPGRRRRAWMIAAPLDDDPVTTGVPEYLFTAPAQAMALVLEQLIDQHGSVPEMVRTLPISPTTIARLTDGLLEG